MSKDLETTAITYLRHLENREWADAQALCTEHATVWHNDGKGDSTIQENIAGMKAQIDPIRSMRYDIIRQFSRPGEVLQQHVVNVTMKDGAHFRLDAAVYFRFEDGRITRIEEYAGVPSQDAPAAP
ncbi:nuclear transport factor 2 family protein [Amycolatopsis jejuensis]|uniref:nuclear transport factor 2 family protein n=1 Tax=Amycolatopsis jejuensis TaxID=330084 RepID=UPI00052537EC|nr:nuclear transport factor 2 family protein [Amycolatopsis jejuensis]